MATRGVESSPLGNFDDVEKHISKLYSNLYSKKENRFFETKEVKTELITTLLQNIKRRFTYGIEFQKPDHNGIIRKFLNRILMNTASLIIKLRLEIFELFMYITKSLLKEANLPEEEKNDYIFRLAYCKVPLKSCSAPIKPEIREKIERRHGHTEIRFLLDKMLKLLHRKTKLSVRDKHDCFSFFVQRFTQLFADEFTDDDVFMLAKRFWSPRIKRTVPAISNDHLGHPYLPKDAILLELNGSQKVKMEWNDSLDEEIDLEMYRNTSIDCFGRNSALDGLVYLLKQANLNVNEDEDGNDRWMKLLLVIKERRLVQGDKNRYFSRDLSDLLERCHELAYEAALRLFKDLLRQKVPIDVQCLKSLTNWSSSEILIQELFPVLKRWKNVDIEDLLIHFASSKDIKKDEAFVDLFWKTFSAIYFEEEKVCDLEWFRVLNSLKEFVELSCESENKEFSKLVNRIGKTFQQRGAGIKICCWLLTVSQYKVGTIAFDDSLIHLMTDLIKNAEFISLDDVQFSVLLRVLKSALHSDFQDLRLLKVTLSLISRILKQESNRVIEEVIIGDDNQNESVNKLFRENFTDVLAKISERLRKNGDEHNLCHLAIWTLIRALIASKTSEVLSFFDDHEEFLELMREEMFCSELKEVGLIQGLIQIITQPKLVSFCIEVMEILFSKLFKGEVSDDENYLADMFNQFCRHEDNFQSKLIRDFFIRHSIHLTMGFNHKFTSVRASCVKIASLTCGLTHQQQTRLMQVVQRHSNDASNDLELSKAQEVAAELQRRDDRKEQKDIFESFSQTSSIKASYKISKEMCLEEIVKLKQQLNEKFTSTSAEEQTHVQESMNDDEVPDELKDYIPTDLDSLIETPTMKKNLDLIMDCSKNPVNVILEGPTGIGKTAIVLEVAGRLRKPLIRCNMCANTTTANIFGSTVPTHDGEKIAISFKEGSFTRAYRSGAWLLLDEMNLAPERILSCIENALDLGVLFLPTESIESKEVDEGKRSVQYKKHPDFRLFCTQNPNSGNYKGRRENQSSAMLSRYIPVTIQEPTIEEMRLILRTRFENRGLGPKVAKKTAKFVIETHEEVLKIINQPTFLEAHEAYAEITLRDVIRWADRVQKKICNLSKFTEKCHTVLATSAWSVYGVRFRQPYSRTCIREVIQKKLNPQDHDFGKPALTSPSFDRSEMTLSIGDQKYQLLLPKAEPNATRIKTFCHETYVKSVQIILEDSSVSYPPAGLPFLKKCLSLIESCYNYESEDESIRKLYIEFLSLSRKESVRQKISEMFAMNYKGTFKRDLGRISLPTVSLDRTSPAVYITSEMRCCWSLIMQALEHKQPVLLTGASGCGKSQTIQTLGNVLHKTLIHVHLSPQTEPEVLVGNFVPIENKTIEWQDGPVTRAAKEGHWLVLENLSEAPSTVLERLNSVLETPAMWTVSENTREPPKAVKIHENFRIFATMTPPSAKRLIGANMTTNSELSPALYNRFSIIHTNDPLISTPEEVQEIFDSVAGDSSLCGQREQIVTSFQSIKDKQPMSVRQLVRTVDGAYKLLHNAELKITPAEALKTVFELNVSPAKSLVHKAKEPIDLKAFEKVYESVRKSSVQKQDFIIDKKSTPSQFRNACLLSTAILCNYPALLEGPAATGKTSLVAHLSECLNHKMERVNNTENTSVTDYLGSVLPDGSLAPGPLIRAMRNGYFFLADEFDLAEPAILNMLYPLLEGHRSITIPGVDKEETAVDGFRFFATQNGSAYAGRKELPTTLRSRFTELTFEEFSEAELEFIIRSKDFDEFQEHPNLKKEVQEIAPNLAQAYKAINKLGQGVQMTMREVTKWIRRKCIFPKTNWGLIGYQLFYLRIGSQFQADLHAIMKSFPNSSDIRQWNPKEKNFEVLRKDKNMIIQNVHHPEQKLSFVRDETVFNDLKNSPACFLEYLWNVCVAIESREPVLLIGPTSCKSHLIETWCRLKNRSDIVYVLCNRDTDSAEFIGRLRPYSQKGALRLLRELAKQFSTVSQTAIKNFPSDDKTILQKAQRFVEDDLKPFLNKLESFIDEVISKENDTNDEAVEKDEGSKELAPRNDDKIMGSSELSLIMVGGNKNFAKEDHPISKEGERRNRSSNDGQDIGDSDDDDDDDDHDNYFDAYDDGDDDDDDERETDLDNTPIDAGNNEDTDDATSVKSVFSIEPTDDEEDEDEIESILDGAETDEEEATDSDDSEDYTDSHFKPDENANVLQNSFHDQIFDETIQIMDEFFALFGECSGSEMPSGNFDSLEFVRNKFASMLTKLRKADSTNRSGGESHVFFFQDGPCTLAIKNSRILVLEDIDQPSQAVTERLNSLFETTPFFSVFEDLTVNDNEKKGDAQSKKSSTTLKVSPNMAVFATVNAASHKKLNLSAAIRSRMSEIIVMKYDDNDLLQISQIKALHQVGPDVEVNLMNLIRHFRQYLSISAREIVEIGKFIRQQIHDSKSTSKDLTSDDFFRKLVTCAVIFLWIDRIKVNDEQNKKGLHIKKVLEILRIKYDDELRIVCEGTECPNESWATVKKINNARYAQLENLMFKCELAPGVEDVKPLIDLHISKTAYKNIVRIFAAVQSHTNLLLNGPPGVGKTKLIESLATALGFQCVRINMSANTTFEDLMGSFIPRMIKGCRRFEFLEGVLLKALKNSDKTWILLDEVNLAQSTLLEKLMPIFARHKSMRLEATGESISWNNLHLFATKNPENIGGGRNKLPTAIESRFLTINLSDFSPEEFIVIANSKMFSETGPVHKGCIPAAMVPKIIEFHSEITSAVKWRKLGAKTAGMQFNLRDIEKFISAAETNSEFHRLATQSKSNKSLSVEIEGLRLLLDLIYIRRLSDNGDVEEARKMIDHCLPSKNENQSKEISLWDCDEELREFVRIGFIYLKKGDYPVPRYLPFSYNDDMLRNLIGLAAATRTGFSILLQGGNASGKTALIVELARLAQQKLIVFPMNDETTISDLLGSWTLNNATVFKEKAREKLSRMLTELCQVHFQASKSKGFNSLEKHYKNHGSSYESKEVEIDSLKEAALDLFKRIEKSSKQVPKTLKDRVNEIKVECRALCENFVLAANPTSTQQISFSFIQGPLVEAVRKGFWILLDNIGQAPGDVLERLNPLAEANPQLALTESGNEEVLTRESGIHSNFRLFATNNTKRTRKNQLSSAFRNRCIEFHLPSLDEIDRGGKGRDESKNDKNIVEGGTDLLSISLCEVKKSRIYTLVMCELEILPQSENVTNILCLLHMNVKNECEMRRLQMIRGYEITYRNLRASSGIILYRIENGENPLEALTAAVLRCYCDPALTTNDKKKVKEIFAAALNAEKDDIDELSNTVVPTRILESADVKDKDIILLFGEFLKDLLHAYLFCLKEVELDTFNTKRTSKDTLEKIVDDILKLIKPFTHEPQLITMKDFNKGGEIGTIAALWINCFRKQKIFTKNYPDFEYLLKDLKQQAQVFIHCIISFTCKSSFINANNRQVVIENISSYVQLMTDLGQQIRSLCSAGHSSRKRERSSARKNCKRVRKIIDQLLILNLLIGGLEHTKRSEHMRLLKGMLNKLQTVKDTDPEHQRLSFAINAVERTFSMPIVGSTGSREHAIATMFAAVPEFKDNKEIRAVLANIEVLSTRFTIVSQTPHKFLMTVVDDSISMNTFKDLNSLSVILNFLEKLMKATNELFPQQDRVESLLKKVGAQVEDNVQELSEAIKVMNFTIASNDKKLTHKDLPKIRSEAEYLKRSLTTMLSELNDLRNGTEMEELKRMVNYFSAYGRQQLLRELSQMLNRGPFSRRQMSTVVKRWGQFVRRDEMVDIIALFDECLLPLIRSGKHAKLFILEDLHLEKELEEILSSEVSVEIIILLSLRDGSFLYLVRETVSTGSIWGVRFGDLKPSIIDEAMATVTKVHKKWTRNSEVLNNTVDEYSIFFLSAMIIKKLDAMENTSLLKMTNFADSDVAKLRKDVLKNNEFMTETSPSLILNSYDKFGQIFKYLDDMDMEAINIYDLKGLINTVLQLKLENTKDNVESEYKDKMETIESSSIAIKAKMIRFIEKNEKELRRLRVFGTLQKIVSPPEVRQFSVVFCLIDQCHKQQIQIQKWCVAERHDDFYQVSVEANSRILANFQRIMNCINDSDCSLKHSSSDLIHVLDELNKTLDKFICEKFPTESHNVHKLQFNVKEVEDCFSDGEKSLSKRSPSICSLEEFDLNSRLSEMWRTLENMTEKIKAHSLDFFSQIVAELMQNVKQLQNSKNTTSAEVQELRQLVEKKDNELHREILIVKEEERARLLANIYGFQNQNVKIEFDHSLLSTVSGKIKPLSYKDHLSKIEMLKAKLIPKLDGSWIKDTVDSVKLHEKSWNIRQSLKRVLKLITSETSSDNDLKAGLRQLKTTLDDPKCILLVNEAMQKIGTDKENELIIRKLKDIRARLKAERFDTLVSLSKLQDQSLEEMCRSINLFSVANTFTIGSLSQRLRHLKDLDFYLTQFLKLAHVDRDLVMKQESVTLFDFIAVFCPNEDEVYGSLFMNYMRVEDVAISKLDKTVSKDSFLTSYCLKVENEDRKVHLLSTAKGMELQNRFVETVENLRNYEVDSASSAWIRGLFLLAFVRRQWADANEMIESLENADKEMRKDLTHGVNITVNRRRLNKIQQKVEKAKGQDDQRKYDDLMTKRDTLEKQYDEAITDNWKDLIEKMKAFQDEFVKFIRSVCDKLMKIIEQPPTSTGLPEAMDGKDRSNIQETQFVLWIRQNETELSDTQFRIDRNESKTAIRKVFESKRKIMKLLKGHENKLKDILGKDSPLFLQQQRMLNFAGCVFASLCWSLRTLLSQTEIDNEKRKKLIDDFLSIQNEVKEYSDKVLCEEAVAAGGGSLEVEDVDQLMQQMNSFDASTNDCQCDFDDFHIMHAKRFIARLLTFSLKSNQRLDKSDSDRILELSGFPSYPRGDAQLMALLKRLVMEQKYLPGLSNDETLALDTGIKHMIFASIPMMTDTLHTIDLSFKEPQQELNTTMSDLQVQVRRKEVDTARDLLNASVLMNRIDKSLQSLLVAFESTNNYFIETEVTAFETVLDSLNGVASKRCLDLSKRHQQILRSVVTEVCKALSVGKNNVYGCYEIRQRFTELRDQLVSTRPKLKSNLELIYRDCRQLSICLASLLLNNDLLEMLAEIHMSDEERNGETHPDNHSRKSQTSHSKSKYEPCAMIAEFCRIGVHEVVDLACKTFEAENRFRNIHERFEETILTAQKLIFRIKSLLKSPEEKIQLIPGKECDEIEEVKSIIKASCMSDQGKLSWSFAMVKSTTEKIIDLLNSIKTLSIDLQRLQKTSKDVMASEENKEKNWFSFWSKKSQSKEHDAAIANITVHIPKVSKLLLSSFSCMRGTQDDQNNECVMRKEWDSVSDNLLRTIEKLEICDEFHQKRLEHSLRKKLMKLTLNFTKIEFQTFRPFSAFELTVQCGKKTEELSTENTSNLSHQQFEFHLDPICFDLQEEEKEICDVRITVVAVRRKGKKKTVFDEAINLKNLKRGPHEMEIKNEKATTVTVTLELEVSLQPTKDALEKSKNDKMTSIPLRERLKEAKSLMVEIEKWTITVINAPSKETKIINEANVLYNQIEVTIGSVDRMMEDFKAHSFSRQRPTNVDDFIGNLPTLTKLVSSVEKVIDDSSSFAYKSSRVSENDSKFSFVKECHKCFKAMKLKFESMKRNLIHLISFLVRTSYIYCRNSQTETKKMLDYFKTVERNPPYYLKTYITAIKRDNQKRGELVEKIDDCVNLALKCEFPSFEHIKAFPQQTATITFRKDNDKDFCSHRRVDIDLGVFKKDQSNAKFSEGYLTVLAYDVKTKYEFLFGKREQFVDVESEKGEIEQNESFVCHFRPRLEKCLPGKQSHDLTLQLQTETSRCHVKVSVTFFIEDFNPADLFPYQTSEKDTSIMDLKQVRAGSRIDESFTIKNQASFPLRLKFFPQESGVEVKRKELLLKPRQDSATQTFSLTASAVEGNVTIPVQVYYGPSLSHILLIKYTSCVKCFTVNYENKLFHGTNMHKVHNNVIPNEPFSEMVRIRNTGSLPLELRSVENPPCPAGAIKIEETTLIDFEEHIIPILIHPKEEGNWTMSALFKLITPKDREIDEFKISVFITAKWPKLEVSVDKTHFFPKDVNTEFDEKLTIKNVSPVEAKIYSLCPLHPSILRIEEQLKFPIVFKAEETKTVSVSITPVSEQSFAASVLVESNSEKRFEEKELKFSMDVPELSLNEDVSNVGILMTDTKREFRVGNTGSLSTRVNVVVKSEANVGNTGSMSARVKAAVSKTEFLLREKQNRRIECTISPPGTSEEQTFPFFHSRIVFEPHEDEDNHFQKKTLWIYGRRQYQDEVLSVSSSTSQEIADHLRKCISDDTINTSELAEILTDVRNKCTTVNAILALIAFLCNDEETKNKARNALNEKDTSLTDAAFETIFKKLQMTSKYQSLASLDDEEQHKVAIDMFNKLSGTNETVQFFAMFLRIFVETQCESKTSNFEGIEGMINIVHSLFEGDNTSESLTALRTVIRKPKNKFSLKNIFFIAHCLRSNFFKTKSASDVGLMLELLAVDALDKERLQFMLLEKYKGLKEDDLRPALETLVQKGGKAKRYILSVDTMELAPAVLDLFVLLNASETSADMEKSKLEALFLSLSVDPVIAFLGGFALVAFARADQPTTFATDLKVETAVSNGEMAIISNNEQIKSVKEERDKDDVNDDGDNDDDDDEGSETIDSISFKTVIDLVFKNLKETRESMGKIANTVNSFKEKEMSLQKLIDITCTASLVIKYLEDAMGIIFQRSTWTRFPQEHDMKRSPSDILKDILESACRLHQLLRISETLWNKKIIKGNFCEHFIHLKSQLQELIAAVLKSIEGKQEDVREALKTVGIDMNLRDIADDYEVEVCYTLVLNPYENKGLGDQATSTVGTITARQYEETFDEYNGRSDVKWLGGNIRHEYRNSRIGSANNYFIKNKYFSLFSGKISFENLTKRSTVLVGAKDTPNSGSDSVTSVEKQDGKERIDVPEKTVKVHVSDSDRKMLLEMSKNELEVWYNCDRINEIAKYRDPEELPSHPQKELKYLLLARITRDLQSRALHILTKTEDGLGKARAITSTPQQMKFIFLVDNSGSMQGSKMMIALTFLLVFLETMKRLEFPTAVVRFGGEASQRVLKHFSNNMDNERGQFIIEAFDASEKTMPADAVHFITNSEELFGKPKEPNEHRFVILITDGLWSQSRKELFTDPLDEAKASMIILTTFPDDNSEEKEAKLRDILGKVAPGAFYEIDSQVKLSEHISKVAHIVDNKIRMLLNKVRTDELLSKQEAVDFAMITVPSDEPSSTDLKYSAAAVEWGSSVFVSDLSAPLLSDDDDENSTVHLNTQMIEEVINKVENVDTSLSSIMKRFQIIINKEVEWKNFIDELDIAFDNVVLPDNQPTRAIQDYRGPKFSLRGFIRFLCTDGHYKKIYENVNAHPRKDYNVAVILDTSSSMCGMTALGSIQAFIGLAASLQNANVNFSLLTAGSKVRLVKGPNEEWGHLTKARAYEAINFEDQHSFIADGILYGSYLVQQKVTSKTVKIIFVISDGMDSAPRRLQMSFRQAEMQDIMVVGLGIGYFTQAIFDFFPFYVVVNHPHSLPEGLRRLFSAEGSRNEKPTTLMIEEEKQVETDGRALRSFEEVWDHQMESVYDDEVQKTKDPLYLSLVPLGDKCNKLGVDVCFVMDTTLSMVHFIEAAKKYIVEMAIDIKKYVTEQILGKECDLKMAFVSFKFFNDKDHLQNHPFSETESVFKMVKRIKASGGRGHEDKFGGLITAMDFDWRENSIKFLVLIGDMPDHIKSCAGCNWCTTERKKRPKKGIVGLVRQIAEKKIHLLFVQVTKKTEQEELLLKTNYEEAAPLDMKNGFRHLDISTAAAAETFISSVSDEIKILIGEFQ